MKFSPEARAVRYPAKMVVRVVDAIFDRCRGEIGRVLDPFCGSGEVLIGAAGRGIDSVGLDINPYATLLAQVRVQGFKRREARALLQDYVGQARVSTNSSAMDWPNRTYWFHPPVLKRLEIMRRLAGDMKLSKTKEGRSVLLAATQAVRLSSLADTRSPKPFISKRARSSKGGADLDPVNFCETMHHTLCELFSVKTSRAKTSLHHVNVALEGALVPIGGEFSHIITSPPYINAQDYFRNFKLELHFLDGILPFSVDGIIHQFVGTERGIAQGLLADKEGMDFIFLAELDPCFQRLISKDRKAAAIVLRYFRDMECAINNMMSKLKRSAGTVWLVCGDNVIAGERIPTASILARMFVDRGMRISERFEDTIQSRSLAPSRKGHRGVIAAESVIRLER